MTLRLPLSHKRHATIISAYTPTLISSEEAFEQFYADLSSIFSTIPAILEDFSARVCSTHGRWDGVLGRHGVGKVNSNSLLLLSKCAEFVLVIANTVFRLTNKYKNNWIHPKSKQWHLIDYVIVRQRDLREVNVTRVMREAESWTDHSLVRTILNLHIVPHHHCQPKLVHTAFNTARLRYPSVLQKFQSKLNEKLSVTGPLTGDPVQKWNQFREVLTDAPKLELGPKKRHHQEWFEETNTYCH
ncbi:craniofacial development protein 2-like [Diadema antillarum]|uniref:craniofacial development protein 2-like n=1 Tax=Diadema antillarum TaxID=105358 RepID=UPI003A85A0E2